jgi:hypothetical protein
LGLERTLALATNAQHSYLIGVAQRLVLHPVYDAVLADTPDYLRERDGARRR